LTASARSEMMPDPMKILLNCLALLLGMVTATAADKKIVLIAGRPSHPPGMHEFRAGCLLLKSCLDQVAGIQCVVYSNGWPSIDQSRDPLVHGPVGVTVPDSNGGTARDEALDGADAVVIYADGGAAHPVLQGNHREILERLARRGVGLGFMHYAVEIPSTNGGPQFLDWVGGYYEHLYSCNPIWSPDYRKFPDHPVTRGVQPFRNRDEWYFNVRFRAPGQAADASLLGAAPAQVGQLTPILVAKPSEQVRQGPYVYPKGPYPHIVDARGRDETMMWTYERPDGGRGFGFTGGHTHANWGDPNQRKVILNALLWIAKADVPSQGVESTVTPQQLQVNQDPKEKPKPQHSFGRQAALADVGKMTAAPGLEASLFACEPDVVNPCDMDIDERGRVWISEGANYRLSLHSDWGMIRPEGDRIVVLEDTDHDGSADKSTIFYQDPSINAALGICVLGNRVIVSASPNVFILTDTDGDGRADQRELLFTDIKGFDHDHAVHAFVFGPDGKLYFNFGNAGEQLRRPSAALKQLPLHGLIDKAEMKKGPLVVDLAGHEVTDQAKPYRQGMVFRCNLDGSEFEVLGHNFRNNYEVAVDSFGTLWQSDNDDDGNRGVRINYVMEFGNFGYTDEITGASWSVGWKKAQAKGASESERPDYHWYQHDPGVVPNLLQTGNGSPTGITVYEGQLLPEVFRHQVIHCDAGPRIVRAYPVKPSGAGYRAEMVDLLTSPDSWFRPSDVCVAPDGSIYVADWHDAGVGGHNMADRYLETMTGRIYRVAPPGNKPSVPRIDLQSAAGGVAALRSPNLCARYLAWTALSRMQGKAEKALAKLWKDDDARLRARALQLLARIQGHEKKYVEAALKDRDADIRITGLRIARQLKMDVIPCVKRLATDASAQVRRECAIALRHNESAEAPTLWATLARQHDGKDRWYLEALGLAMDQQENKFFDAWLATVGDRWNTPAGRDIIWRSRATKVPALIVKIVSDKNLSAQEKDHFLRSLDFIKGPEKEAALVEISTSLVN